jgi:hypothetical protein
MRSSGFYEHREWKRDGKAQREEVVGAIFDEVRMVRASRTDGIR